MSKKYLWKITTLGSPESFEFVGTEREAEGLRCDKEKWEWTIARKEIMRPAKREEKKGPR